MIYCLTEICSQDPNDEIIYHSASLKCGVATYLALKENLWSVRRFDRKFVIAAYVGSPVPLDTVATAAGSLLVRDGGDLSVVERSTAFMASLYSSALPDHSDSVWNAVASAIQLIRRGAVSAVGCAVAGPMPRHEDGAILTECFVQHLAACLLDVHTKTTRYNKNKEQARNKRSEDNDDELDVHVDAHVVVVDSAVRDVADEMWVVIMKIGSDGCGQLLGHAVSKGFDEIRSWVCCFLVFSHITVHDPQLPDVAISLQTGFYALKAIANRLTEACDTDNSSLNSLNSQQRKNKVGISAQVTEFCKVLAFLLDGFELLISLNSEHVDLLSEYESNAETDCRKVDKSGVRYSRSETHPTCGTTTLLPLHCGHNGLPTAAEVAMLVSLIKQKTGVSRGAY